MPYETILYETEEGISLIQLNRPQRKNAINYKMLSELIDLIEKCDRDQHIRVLILAGTDSVFCSGADIREKMPPNYLKKLRYLLHNIETAEKPVIAAINGLALGGGCEIALACDLRVMCESAVIGVPEIKIGSMPAAGGTQRLPRLIGATFAKELLFFGDPIDGKEAYRLGLVNRVVPDAESINEAKKMAKTLADRAPMSLKMAKRAVNMGMRIDLESGLDFEAHCYGILRGSEDLQEGVRAFAEKRKPVWKGS